MHAQSKDTMTAKKIIDNGSKGDIILGEKNKKDRFNNAPIFLYEGNSICRKDSILSSKKIRGNQIRKGS